LSGPGAAGVRGDAEEVDATGGVLHDEQHREPVQRTVVSVRGPGQD
jgi:hypothetical protein